MCRCEEVCLLEEKEPISFEAICMPSVNIPSMSEENFSVKMGCVSALCVNNSRGV